MGKLIFTPIQQVIFDKAAENKLISSAFYFTGGTALSVFYLQHRYSDDMDFFSEQAFDEELVLNFMETLTSSLNLTYRYTKREIVKIFELVKNGKVEIKIDFGHYNHKRIEKGILYKGVEIDSLRDIAANKLLTINQRTDVKDFVDLYFLIKNHFTFWDLMYALEAKFRLELDLIIFGSDFLKAQDFTFLPRMISPLTLDELKKFYTNLAKETGMRATQP